MFLLSCCHGLIFCLNGHNTQVFTLLICTTVTDSIHLLEISMSNSTLFLDPLATNESVPNVGHISVSCTLCQPLD